MKSKLNSDPQHLTRLQEIVVSVATADIMVPHTVAKPYISKEKIDCLRFDICPLLAPHF